MYLSGLGGRLTPWTDLSKTPVVSPDRSRSTDINLSLVKAWIDGCSNNHEKCRGPSGQPWFPTRLLHLGSGVQHTRLVVTKDNPPSGPYITLSHRWGSQSYTKLKSSTFTQLQRAVDIPSLPQVFQDAIVVAHRLGVHFIWIDSLCIMQDEDDRSDWDIESQTMDKVYYYSFLNISATKSLDGSESLFQTNSWDCDPFFEMDLFVDGALQRYTVVDGDVWTHEIDGAPLNQRGWVFQERFLARRVLHFGEFQMGWECNELSALEMFPGGLPRTTALPFVGKNSLHKAISTLLKQSAPSVDRSFISTWNNIVTAYSQCRLTFNEDKLRAIAGIAKSIMGNTTDRYGAGMWESTILYSLPWYRPQTDRNALPMTRTPRAPSWSWASVDGKVEFPPMFEGIRECFAVLQFFPDLLVAGGEIADPSGGSIRLNGVCLPVSIKWAEEDITSFEVAGFRFPVTDTPWGARIHLEGSPQNIQLSVRQGRVLFMPLYATFHALRAVLLTKVRGVGAHLRVGAVQIEVMVRRRPHQSLADGWIAEPSSGHDELGDYVWNKWALDFINYIKTCRRRVVDII